MTVHPPPGAPLNRAAAALLSGAGNDRMPGRTVALETIAEGVGGTMKLNLGCGRNKLDGYLNIDKYPTCNPDLVWDLEQTPYPFEASAITAIAAFHVLEHIGQTTDVFLAIIKEIHRIMAPGGVIEIKVPHHRSDGYWGDPTHVRPINPAIIGLFSKRNCRMFAERGWPNTPLAEYLDVDFEIDSMSVKMMPAWLQKLQRGEMSVAEVEHAANTYWNVIDEITMMVRKV
jgi:SAM-dependent methyltransferase